MAEKCWKIEEQRPIKVCTRPSYSGIEISVKAGVMKYDTWQHLDHHHRHQDISVSYQSYNYKDGECIFRASSQKDLDLWLEKYKDIVSI